MNSVVKKSAKAIIFGEFTESTIAGPPLLPLGSKASKLIKCYASQLGSAFRDGSQFPSSPSEETKVVRKAKQLWEAEATTAWLIALFQAPCRNAACAELCGAAPRRSRAPF